jgi:hypothetical protein
MEKLLESPNSLPGTLTVIAALLSCHLLFKMGEFLWEILKRKSEVSEQTIQKLAVSLDFNTRATDKLELRLGQIEKDLSDNPRLKRDLDRLFIAVKIIAGDEWERIADSFKKNFGDL